MTKGMTKINKILESARDSVDRFTLTGSFNCPNDTDGDGNCGLKWCPYCHPEKFSNKPTEGK